MKIINEALLDETTGRAKQSPRLRMILDPKKGVYGAEIKAGTWHGLLVLESGSVIYEIKQGPFAPLAPENFAPWSPAPEETEEVENYMGLLRKEA